MVVKEALQAAPVARSTLPLTPQQAKRLLGVLAVSQWPVRYAGHVVAHLQRKRHPYDEWTTLALAGEVDVSNHDVKYRAVLKYPNAQPTRVTRT